MNIFVDPASISEVLLQDGWHTVIPGTLHTGKYALVEPNTPSPATAGFTFQEAGGASIAGPMLSVLAVRRTLAAKNEAKEPPPARPATPTTPPAARAQAPPSRDWWKP